jgi:tetratricopeptide (TPR) repeat protein
MSSARRPPARSQPVENRAAASRRWLPWAAGLSAALAAFVIYAPALVGPFVFDDIYLPIFQRGLPLRQWLAGVRPVVMLSYWLNFRASELDPFPYHLWNLLLHIANSGFVYLIVSRLLDWSGKADAWRRQALALFAGAVFLLHPLQTESVAYVASRSETLSVFFAYAAYTAFLYRRRAATSVLAAAGIIVLFVLAVLSKEHTAALPALLLLTDYYWNPGFSLAGIKRNWKLYAPVAIAGAVGVQFVLNVLRTSDSAGFRLKEITPERYLFSQCRAIWTYLRMFLLPVGQNVDHEFPLSHSVLEHGAIFALLALLSVAILAWIYRKRFPLASFGVFVFLILIAPTSSFVPIKDLLVERRMYLPMLGLLLVMADLLRCWKTSQSVLALTLAGAALALAGATDFRVRAWTSDIALWEDSVAEAPGNSRAHFQLAFAYFQANRCGEASSEYEKTSKLSAAPELRLWVDWALALDCAGRPVEALAILDREKIRYQNPDLYATIGMIAGKQGMADRALAALSSAEAIDPANEMIYLYRGNVFMTQSNYLGAATAYRKALQLNPGLDAARAPLAEAERQLAGKK